MKMIFIPKIHIAQIDLLSSLQIFHSSILEEKSDISYVDTLSRVLHSARQLDYDKASFHKLHVFYNVL
jgi:hypothetical protein